jgi:transcriptional regulator with XRE-family HTH domain
MYQQTCRFCQKPYKECKGRQNGLGKTIRGLRKDAWLSLRDLAGKSSLKVPTLIDIERGAQRPSVDQITQVAKALNLNPLFLLGRSQDRLIDQINREMAT